MRRSLTWRRRPRFRAVVVVVAVAVVGVGAAGVADGVGGHADEHN